ncbi:hypothetical protein ABZX82_08460 [Streptomyces griseoflavus]|uniref:hypothetical protein n=1 Tax=Streptomyces griseoflavus TaxID=35619 RepID=UPI0033BB8DB5
MLALRHTLVLAPVPGPWLVDTLAVLLDVAEGTRAEAGRLLLPDGREVPDARLAEGRHLRPGAVYEGTREETAETVRITVEEWNRRRTLRLAAAVEAPDGAFTVRGALHRPDRPGRFEAEGSARTADAWPALSRVRGRVRLLCGDWWAACAGRTVRTAPLRASVECGVARAELRAVPRPHGKDGAWAVTVTVRVRGRRLFRPVAAVALRLGRRRLRRFLAGALDGFAERWNTEVPALVAMGPDDVRREVLAAGR